MIQQIKELRVRIDGLYQLTKELKPLLIDDGNDYNWHVQDVPLSETDNSRVGLDYFLTANSKEVNKAADSLILAKAWLGKLLGELGSENPYSSGKREVKDIEPTADTAHAKFRFFRSMDGSIKLKREDGEYRDIDDKIAHIEKVDWLRSEIEKIISKERNIKTTLQMYTPEISLITKNVYTHLCEAKMWLGFELRRVRDESK